MRNVLLALLAVYAVIYVVFHIRFHGANFLIEYVAVGIVAAIYNYLSSMRYKKVWAIIGFLAGFYGVLAFLLFTGVSMIRLKRK